MPQIRQFVSQGRTGALRLNPSSQPAGLDLSPLAQAAGQIEDTRARLQEVQRRESERLALDEARMSVTNSLSDGTALWTEKIAAAKTQAPQDAAGFTVGTLKEFDTWANEQTSKQQSPEARRMLEHGIQKMRLGLHADAFQFETQQRTKALADNFVQGLDSDRRAVIADPSKFTDLLAKRLATAEALTVAPDLRAKMVDGARTQLAADAAGALVDQDAQAWLERTGARSAKGAKGKQGSRTEDAAARVAGDPLLSSMSPEALRGSIDRASMIVAQQEAARAAEADRQARLAEIAANKREREANQAWSILSGRAMTGVATDRVADGQLFKALEGTPYAKEYERLAAEIPKRQATAMLPLDMQQQQIDGLIAQRNTRGTSENLEAEIKFRKDVHAAAQKAYADSALRATQQYGIQNIAQIDTSSLPALIDTIGPRVQQAEVARTITKKPESPLLPEEVPALQKHLAALPPDQFGAAIASMAGKVPAGQMSALAKQLDARDRPLALAMAAGADMTTEGRSVAEIIRRGAQFAKDKSVKEDQGAELGLRAQIAKEVGDAVPAAARQDVIDAARLVYMGKQGEGNSISISGAVRLAIGGDLVEHNGRRLPVPAGTNLADRLQAYPRADIDAQAPDGYVYLPGGRPMGVPEFLAALPGAQLEPDGRGRFLVRSGGSLVMNQQRRPIVVNVR